MSTRRPPASLAKRALPALALTGASAGLLLLLDHPTGILTGALAAGRETSSSTTSVAAPGTDVQGGGPPAGSGQTGSTVPAPPTCTGQQTAGPTIDTRWGPVQVEATVSSTGRLCDVDALQSPSDHRRSVMINEEALPILHDRAVAANGTGFDAVSGATVTSEGYRASLQAILDHG
jgi:uncharacterized protein with FMN-binding domain